MNDQTFHTPSFGDEEFDIPPLHMQQHQPFSEMHHHTPHPQSYTIYDHRAPQVSSPPSPTIHHQHLAMGMINPAQDGLSLPDGQPSYQQPLYLQPQEHPMQSAYGSPQPPGNYLIQQQPGGPRLLVMQPPQQPQQGQGQGQQGQTGAGAQPGYGRSPPRGGAPPANSADHHTTSEDSDDSAPHHAPMQAGTAGPVGAATVGGGVTLKRPSPEPAGVAPDAHHLARQQVAKKPKVQKKKKKRDPNEPQKPVSAYALFFRDTQAAIKGQNPNASFGEVSKIVASMWDGLDSEHKSVYKQKTEAAKKEYLKALAAYRASLVSKGGEPEGAMYGGNGVGGGVGNGAGGGGGPGTPYGFYPSGAPPAPYHPGVGNNPPGAANVPLNNCQGQGSPPAPPRSPLVSPPHHLAMMGGGGGMHHAPMGPPHHHHQTYLHHNHNQQTQPSQMQPLNSPHRSPQHHGPQGPQGPMGPQGQHNMAPHNQQMGPGPQQMGQQQQNHQAQQQMNQQGQGQGQGQQGNVNQQGQQQMGQHNHHMAQQNHQMMSGQGQGQQGMSMGGGPNRHSPPHNQHQMMNSHQQHPQGPQSNGGSDGGAGACIRHGCTNPAIANNEWEDEYCSNECVVSHCRDVFTSWVASNNNQSQTYSAVK